LSGLLDKLYENQAHTDQESEDPRLQGRTYTIPFEDVWQASMRVGGGGLLGWSIGRFNDKRGVIEALAKTPIFGFETDVHIQVGLDHLGQTRVDVTATSRKEKGDWGRSKRLIGRFIQGLDHDLSVRPEQVLDPTQHPIYKEST